MFVSQTDCGVYVCVCVWERKILWCDMWDLVVVWKQEKVLWSQLLQGGYNVYRFVMLTLDW